MKHIKYYEGDDQILCRVQKRHKVESIKPSAMRNLGAVVKGQQMPGSMQAMGLGQESSQAEGQHGYGA